MKLKVAFQNEDKTRLRAAIVYIAEKGSQTLHSR
jgi:hypothetical protein